MGGIYAGIVRDGDIRSLGLAGETPIADYELVLGDETLGRLVVCAASSVGPADAGSEVKELKDDCIGALLAAAVGELAAQEATGEIDEPAFDKPGKRSAGVVLVDQRGWITIREAANHFDGYFWSYAKGRIDDGETPQKAARRELTEETGLTGRIVGRIGDFKGHTGFTRLYVGVSTGGELRHTPTAETWDAETVSPLSAFGMLNVQRDKDALVRLVELAAGAVEWSWTIGGRPTRCRLVEGRIRCSAEAAPDG